MSSRSPMPVPAFVSRARSGFTKLTTVALLGLLAAACADDKPLNTFEPRGPQAREIDNLMMWIWPIMGVVFVAVVGGGIVLAIKNRVKPEDYDPEDLPSQTHGNTPLELAWTIAPAVLLAVICFPMIQSIWSLEEKNEAGELDVMVIGQQWWWEYRYDADGDGFFVDANGDGQVDDADRELPLEISLDPDDIVTANELVIPAGQQIDLTLTSRDVIHSFWIPRLNGKRDTVPGRWHSWSLEADEPGKYTGWCTEYCGLSHARMRMSAIALNEADWAVWWENQKSPADIPAEGTDEAAGRELYLNNCQRCHVITDGDLVYSETYNQDIALVSKAAPNLTHFATRTTFAGGIYSVYLGGPESLDANDDALDASDYVRIPELADGADELEDYRLNSAELKRWISNAPERKAAAAEPVAETGLGRGMPAFTDLSDEQLDQIVAYLATLD